MRNVAGYRCLLGEAIDHGMVQETSEEDLVQVSSCSKCTQRDGTVIWNVGGNGIVMEESQAERISELLGQSVT